MIRAESTVSDKDQWTAKGRATRSRIVEAAARLMHARGVAGTSTEDVLNAAAVSNSQLYHYFADKDDLTRAVVGHQIDQVVGRQEVALARLDSVAALLDWRDTIVSYPSRPGWRGGCPIGSLASELADTDEPARLALTAGFARWQTAIRDGLNAMRDRGELRADADPDRLALATLAAPARGAAAHTTRRDAAPLAAALDMAIAHIESYASGGRT